MTGRTGGSPVVKIATCPLFNLYCMSPFQPMFPVCLQSLSIMTEMPKKYQLDIIKLFDISGTNISIKVS